MTRNGAPLTVNQLAPQAGFGLNTLVWEPQVDLTTPANFHVLVTGITVASTPRTVSYDVAAFGPDATPPVATLRTPGSAASYRQGTTVAADFDCSDGAGGSGVAVASVPWPTARRWTPPPSALASSRSPPPTTSALQATTHASYSVTTRPDLAASVGAAGAVRGNNVYGTGITTAQTLSANVARGATRTYVARVGNDGGAPATFRLRATASGAAGFTLKIKRDGVDVTSQVLAGDYTLTDLAAGATVALKVKVTATTASARAAVRNVDLTLSSTAGPTAKDKFRLAPPGPDRGDIAAAVAEACEDRRMSTPQIRRAPGACVARTPTAERRHCGCGSAQACEDRRMSTPQIRRTPGPCVARTPTAERRHCGCGSAEACEDRRMSTPRIRRTPGPCVARTPTAGAATLRLWVRAGLRGQEDEHAADPTSPRGLRGPNAHSGAATLRLWVRAGLRGHSSQARGPGRI